MFSATVLFGSSPKLYFRLGVLKHISASASVRWGVLHGAARTSVFFYVLLISGNAIQPLCSVCYELGAFLSLFVYIANVCSCKVCICMCVVLLLKK